MALKVKVSFPGFVGMLKFKNMPDSREKHISKSSTKDLPTTYASNAKAEQYHPKFQNVIVSNIRTDYAGTKIIELKAEQGRLAPFRAGQYITVGVQAGDTKTIRPYSLSGSPDKAKDGIYEIAVKKDDKGFISPIIHNTWEVGTKLTISAPEGYFYYDPIRDSKKVVALAGGIGITPFMSMAKAIKDGKEDFDLTVIYGTRKLEDAIYRNELDEIAKSCNKVHVVYVLSDEKKEGFENGFITSKLVEKYVDKETSVFVCGPQAMYDAMAKELQPLGLDQKHYRRELYGMIRDASKMPGFPASAKGKTFKCKVVQCGETKDIKVAANEPILVALEKAGLKAPSRCRSGECGWCRSALLKGNVFIPELCDGRRAADKKYNYIHPCATFATSDIEIELPAGDNFIKD